MQKLETTEQHPSSILIARDNTSAGSITPEVERQIQSLFKMQTAALTLSLLSRCGDATGGYVQFKHQYHFIPMLIGVENEATPLYEFVEVLDDLVDYDAVVKELPHLTYAHIGGALAFLRTMAQTNPSDIDIDRHEDLALMSNPEFVNELRTALADEEISRVLNRD